MFEWLFVLLLNAAFPGPAPLQDASAVAERPLGSSRPAASAPELDRVASAVEMAESSLGADKRMWRADIRGPQGPMQVSQSAASDVGGGDRFDAAANREIGRAYLAEMFRRYGNWQDAVIAYNWGPANLNRWIAAGRPPENFLARIRPYVDRVMGAIEELSPGSAPLPALPKPSALPVAAAAPSPPPPELRHPALRRVFVRDQDEIGKLQVFIDATAAAGDRKRQPGGPNAQPGIQPPSPGDRKALIALVNRIATRPGFAEFRLLPEAKPAGPATLAAQREIVRVLIGKLQAESAALVLIDRRQAVSR